MQIVPSSALDTRSSPSGENALCHSASMSRESGYTEPPSCSARDLHTCVAPFDVCAKGKYILSGDERTSLWTVKHKVVFRYEKPPGGG